MTPAHLGPYEIVRRIGVGGMAEVMLGRRAGPAGFAKPVALKRLLPEIARDAEVRAMFVEEARLQAGLSHRNLVQVFDFGEDSGDHYLVMEYVDGTDLAALLARQRQVPPPLALQVAAEICQGLDYLHGQGVVHRDVSPGNIYLSRAGEVKLGDFGIAKGRAASLRTERGRLKGKLAYLSPEQARGEAADVRADLYALGLVLFEMLAGERYLRGEAEADLLRAAMAPEPRPAGAGEKIDPLVQRLLLAQREDRLPSAKLAAQAIQTVQATLGPAPGPSALAAWVTGSVPLASAIVDLSIKAPGTERLTPRRALRWPVLAGLLLAGGVALALWAAQERAPTPEISTTRAPIPGEPAAPAHQPVPSDAGQGIAPARPPARPARIGQRRPAPEKPPAPPTGSPDPSPPAPAAAPAIDRSSIERRLAVLDKRMEAARLDDATRARARRLAQQALNDTLEQRYAEADRRLDALEALLTGTPPP